MTLHDHNETETGIIPIPNEDSDGNKDKIVTLFTRKSKQICTTD